jgi:hypothetical protein
MELLGHIGVCHRLGGDRGVDLEQPQVVSGELVQAELGQHDNADGYVFVEHRRQQQRLIRVVGRARNGH